MAPLIRAPLRVCLLVGSSLLPLTAWAQTEDPDWEDCEPQTSISYVLPQTRLTAAFYYPWYRATPDCPGDQYWCDCFSFPKGGPNGNPRPAAGFYASNDPEAVGRHLDQMQAHGIDVVGVEWAAFHDETNHGDASQWDAAVRTALLPELELETRNLRWVLLYDLGIRYGPDNLNFTLPDGQTPNTDLREDIVDDFEAFADANEPYFHHSKYLKFGDRPVVYIYISRAIQGNFDHIQHAFTAVRQAIVSGGFTHGAYIVADHLDYYNFETEKLEAIGAHAVTTFAGIDPAAGVDDEDPEHPPVRVWADRINNLLYTPVLDELASTERLYDLQPGVFPQYDDNGFGPNQACAPSPPRAVQRYHLRGASDWAYMIDRAGLPHRKIAVETRVDAHCNEFPSQNTDTSILWVYSFNEWGEGAGIEELDVAGSHYPYAFGTELLTTLAGKVGGGGGPTGTPEPPVQRDPEGYVSGLRPLFAWDAVPYGDQYRLEIEGPGAPEPVETGSTTYLATSNLEAGQEYTWRVKAHNTLGWGPFSEAISFTPHAPCTEPPEHPTLISPSGCVQTVRPTLVWPPADGAVDYKVALWEVNPEYLLKYKERSETWYTPDVDLVWDREYRWSVKARNGCGEPWSYQMFYFTPRLDCTAPPIATAPWGCTRLARPTFSWTQVEGASGYRLAVFEVATGRQVLDVQELGGTSYTPSINLAPGREHRWRVAAVYGQEEEWSQELHFTPGCGFQDIFWYEDGTGLPAWGVFTSTGQDFQYAGNWGYFGPVPPTWMYGGDFNGDGFGDVFFLSSGLGRHVFTSDGTQFQDQGMWGPLSWNPVWAAVGDFTGDGKDDVAYREQEGGIRVLRSTGTSFIDAPGWYPEVHTVPTWSGVGDFNGDGFDDLVWYEDGTLPAVGVFFSTGSGFVNGADWGLFATERLTPPEWASVGDFNGDRKDDILWCREEHGLQVFLSAGDRFIDAGNWGVPAGWQSRTWTAVGDFTRDGKDDIVWHWEGLRVLRSTGNRFLGFPARWYPPLAIPSRTLIGNYDTN